MRNMKNQHIRCLEKILIPLNKESSLVPQIKPQTIQQKSLNLLEKIDNPLKEFQKDLTFIKDKKIADIERNLSQILGYGLGSTPESDDILLGILVAKFSLNENIDEAFKYLAIFPFEKFTTAKSAQLIRSILRRNFPPELVSFIELLKIQDEDNQLINKFEVEVRKIKKLGTSSGYYFLLGVLWELENNEKSEYPSSRRIS